MKRIHLLAALLLASAVSCSSLPPTPPPAPIEPATPASFVTNKTGLDLNEYYEGLYLKAYKDRVGTWTLCFGRTKYPNGKPVQPGDTATKPDCEAWLLSDLESEGAHYVRAWTHDLNMNQFSALTSFTFNRGAGRLRALLDMSHSNEEIANNLLKFDYAGTEDNHLLGLKRRRRSERALFNGEDWTPFKDWRD